MDYLGLDEPDNHISFGTTMNRPTFPNQIAPDRFGNEFNPLRGVKDVGPGQYDNHEKTTFTYFTKPVSLRGYMLGARTEERHFSPIPSIAPAPNHYQPSNSLNKSFKPAYKPFSAASERFENDPKEISPGPGTYEFDVERNRNVQMLHSFGGRAHILPAVDIKCTINNIDKCENCSEKPLGDYYQFKKHVLCSKCYDYNWKWQEKYNRSFLSSLRKVRDCEFMHEHQGTTAAIQKMSEKDLKKLKRKEAYLSLYWA